VTPNVGIVGIHTPSWRGFRLWIPLFLLWIPLILLFPLILLVVAGVCIAWNINLWRTIAALWAISWSLSGTHVHVNAAKTEVLVRLL
jgi:hypothetical protein